MTMRRRRRSERGALGVCLCSAVLIGTACSSDTNSVERADTDASADHASTTQCKSHRDCVTQHGAHWICRSNGSCVNALSDTCNFIRGDDENKDAVFVGVIGVEGSPIFGVSELARGDFTSAVGGLPTAAGTKPRPFVLVGCSFKFGEDPLPAARHLVATVGVQAIVGPQGSEPTINIAQNVTIPADVLLMSVSALSDLITDLPDEDLVFRTSPSSTRVVAPQLAAMVSDAEAKLRAQGTILPIKVALVTSRNAYGLAINAATLPLLRFNGGLSAEENAARGQFLAVSFDTAEDAFEQDVAARVLAFAPQIVVALGGIEARPFIAIEEAFAATSVPPPYYVTDTAVSDAHAKFIASRPDSLRQRYRTSFQDPTRAIAQAYQARITREFGDSPNLLAGGSIYDAMYAVAYGIIATSGSPLTGHAIASGIRRLVGPGEAIEILPERIARGVELLAAGETIDIDGVTGPLDFDAQGDVTADAGVGCYVRDPVTNAVSLVFSGQVYRARTATLEGLQTMCQ